MDMYWQSQGLGQLELLVIGSSLIFNYHLKFNLIRLLILGNRFGSVPSCAPRGFQVTLSHVTYL